MLFRGVDSLAVSVQSAPASLPCGVRHFVDDLRGMLPCWPLRRWKVLKRDFPGVQECTALTLGLGNGQGTTVGIDSTFQGS
jgi:hypothetical protein